MGDHQTDFGTKIIGIRKDVNMTITGQEGVNEAGDETITKVVQTADHVSRVPGGDEATPEGERKDNGDKEAEAKAEKGPSDSDFKHEANRKWLINNYCNLVEFSRSNSKDKKFRVKGQIHVQFVY